MRLAGYSDEFEFEYRHYGPFSEDLAAAMEVATGLGLVTEDERRTDWGAWYSIYSVDCPATPPGDQSKFVSEAVRIGSIELELAATAAYLFAVEGVGQNDKRDPWVETARRKPGKAGEGRLDRAKVAYSNLLKLQTPIPLPRIV